MKIRPLDDRILIKPEEAEEQTASGIYLPDTAREKPLRGKVVSVGPGKLNDEGKRSQVSLKRGDTVVYGKFAGTEVDLDGQSHMLVRESELLAKVEG